VYGKHQTDEIASAGSDPNTQPVDAESHAIIAEMPGYDLPPATHNATGARANLFSAGNPFMSGGAVFTSAHGPQVTGGHKCVCAREGTYPFVDTLRRTACAKYECAHRQHSTRVASHLWLVRRR
jgi:hypothetical protein